jgi:16S rRNA processing protein RimM
MSEKKPVKKAKKIIDQGSPEPGEPVFILLGKIRKPHGLDAEMIVDAYSESPDRFKPGTRVFAGEEHLPLTIRTRRSIDKALLLTFKDIDDTETAGQYRNHFIYTVKEELPPLPEGEYYHFDLIGLEVVNEAGSFLGRISEVIETGANDVYVVTNTEGEESLLPAIKSVILSVDLAAGKMVVNPPEWI